jgi:hypothetical protein
MARLHPPAVTEKLVPVLASEELSKLDRADRLGARQPSHMPGTNAHKTALPR